MRLTGLVLTAALLGTSAPARLCRDTKGLYTPCAEAVGKPAKAGANAASTVATLSTPSGDVPVHRRANGAKPDKPALFTNGKLCRDSKGLFTPCA